MMCPRPLGPAPSPDRAAAHPAGPGHRGQAWLRDHERSRGPDQRVGHDGSGDIVRDNQAETDERPDPELDDERRRCYRLTGLGARVLDAEVARMEQLARAAQLRRAVARRRLGLEGG